MTAHHTVPCTLMRAGTSRGPFFLRDWLPADPAALEQALIGAIGASDPLQLDGLGGGSSLNSKVAIVSRSREADCDLDYLFAQVGVGVRSVDLRPNCGNMLSGVVPFAIEQGLIEPAGDLTTVRVFNVNTRARIDVTVCTPGGHLTYDGDTRIDGVAGSAAPVRLSFLDCWGSVTGALFPTGRRTDIIDGTEITCIDAAMPLMIVKARALGVTGRETPAELDSNAVLLDRIEKLRRIAGERMGLGDVSASVIPKPVLVSPGDDPVSITSRYFTPLRCHSSHAVTGAIGVTTAFALPGTVASGSARPRGTHRLAVLHPEGRIEVEIETQGEADDVSVSRAALLRTARKIMQGELTLPAYVFAGVAARRDDARAPSTSRATPRPIDIVVPTAAGGANDAVARLLARAFAAKDGRVVRTDNRAGASGTIACKHVRHAPPDGCALLLGYTATHAIHPAWEDVGYDPRHDFTPIGSVCASPMVLVVRSESRHVSANTLMIAVRDSGIGLRYAAAGRGTLSHLGAALLGQLAEGDVQPRFFDGSAPALADVCDGGSDFMLASLHAALPFLRSGTMRALCAASGADHPQLVGVPSMASEGLETIDFSQWYALFAPPGTPNDIVQARNAELAAALAQPSVAVALRENGAIVTGGTSADLAALVDAELRRWRDAIATLHAPMLEEVIE
jgi:2-methylaconitate cis-trans-isomerase PrpF/tripartite-type tricarboxylate transporter receptor subunit TctC